MNDRHDIELLAQRLMDSKPVQVSFCRKCREEDVLAVINGIEDIYRSLGGERMIISEEFETDGMHRYTIKPKDEVNW